MEGVYVYVCQFPSNVCLPCGVTPDTDSGQWAQLYCAGGWIEGNRVRILHSYNQLQFCEIHVFGMEMGEFFIMLYKCKHKGKTLIQREKIQAASFLMSEALKNMETQCVEDIATK